MANATVFPGDIVSPQQISAGTLFSSNPFLTDAMVVLNAGAGGGIKATKLQAQSMIAYSNGDAAANAVSEQRCIYYVFGATGTIVDFRAGAVALLTGNATCTIDLLVGGVTVLTAAIALAAGDTIRVAKVATIATPALVAANMIEVKVVATVNTGALPKGVFAMLTLRSDAQ